MTSMLDLLLATGSSQHLSDDPGDDSYTPPRPVRRPVTAGIRAEQLHHEHRALMDAPAETRYHIADRCEADREEARDGTGTSCARTT